MPEFFPIGEKDCLLNKKCTSFGVYQNYCCGITMNECCGAVTIAGWILAGALVAIIVIVVFLVVCKR
ncbi:hypothetical protein COOONC_20266, partial [Cooperia oncophora]